jgi:aryl-alcohol dehydrogenase-like predicted oxidoreductase
MINKLALGTAQFGLNYGITNHSGQIKIKEAIKILDLAKNSGIYTIDTSANYGDSEKVLGKIGVKDCQIITKTITLRDDINIVIEGLEESLLKLNIQQLEGVLIHNFDDLKNKNFNILFRKLEELKKEDVVKKIGFSTYTPEQVDFLIENFDFDIIQLPFNIFDNRLIEGGQLKKLKQRGVEVHARSIFLQGILLELSNLSHYFLSWQKEFQDYQQLVNESEMSSLEYALNYVLGIQEIDKALVGVNNELQLSEIIKSVKNKIYIKAFPINNSNLLNPSLWKI